MLFGLSVYAPACVHPIKLCKYYMLIKKSNKYICAYLYLQICAPWEAAGDDLNGQVTDAHGGDLTNLPTPRHLKNE